MTKKVILNYKIVHDTEGVNNLNHKSSTQTKWVDNLVVKIFTSNKRNKLQETVTINGKEKV